MISNSEKFDKIHHQVETSDYYLEGIRTGNTQVLEAIYAEFSELITRMIVNNNGTAEEAKDIFQDVLLSFFRQSQSGLEIQCSFSSFLIIACKRRWLNYLNSKYKSSTFKIEQRDPTLNLVNDDVDVLFDNELRMNIVKNALSMMDDSCKEIIELSWQTDADGKFLGWMDVATILNMSYGYVRKRASECKNRLIELVKKDIRYNELRYEQ